MTRIIELGPTTWQAVAESGTPDAAEVPAVAALERGDVLFLPSLGFTIAADERPLFSPGILSSAKNASFDPSTGRVGGTTAGADVTRLAALMRRFSDAAAALVESLLPPYRPHLVRARTSFRPAEIAGRSSSWRKDDTRLHVDSFPASPVQGRRILRVFSNVNPDGKPRRWRVGGEFESLVDRFGARLSLPWPGHAAILSTLRMTKSRRTPYDALMLQLHDRMKADADFQRYSAQTTVDFPAGTTWLTFTDAVSHAAMAGQYQLEQTFLLPVDAMSDERQAPLRVLERAFHRRLV